MIKGLAKELTTRMQGVGVRGRLLTLKVKKKKSGAKPPPKFLGHGSCHNLSKSVDLGKPTVDENLLSQAATHLLGQLKVKASEIRGMGMVLSKLDTAEITAHGIDTWFKRLSEAPRQPLSPKPNSGSLNNDGDETDDGSQNEVVIEEVDENSVNSQTEEVLEGMPLEADDFEIVLPSASQLHLSQVRQLPSPLRKKIHCQLKTREDQAMQLSRTIEQDPLTVRREQTVSPSKGESRMRQTNLKRMLRLAAVKSGQESLSTSLGSPVSMTQFESLPLEIQLQVANNDGCSLGAKDPTSRTPSTSKGDVEDPKTLFPEDSSVGPYSAVTKMNGTMERLTSPTAANLSSLFFRENVFPLMAFMDENPAGDKATQTLVEFVTMFVEDHSLVDLGVLLRSFKNRNDGWGGDVFKSVRDFVVNLVKEKKGVTLDLQLMNLV